MSELENMNRIQIEKLTKIIIEHEVSLTKIKNIVLLDTENLSICSHGIPVKFVCKECATEHIDSLINNRSDQEYKKQVEGLTEIVVSHEEYLRKINTIALADPDKISHNFSELEGLIKHAQERIEGIEKRLHVLESKRSEIEYKIQLQELYKNKN